MASLTPEERNEVAVRQNLISIHRRTADLLESELRLFFNHLLISKGLNPEKRYTLDSESGELTEE